MKKSFGLITALLLIPPVMAHDDIVISSTYEGSTWVVMDGDVYFCNAFMSETATPDNPVCVKAEMKDPD